MRPNIFGAKIQMRCFFDAIIQMRLFGGKIQPQLLFTFPFSMLNKTPPSFKIDTDSGIIGDDNVSATFWSTPTSPGFVALSSVDVDIDDVRVALTSTTTMSTLFS